MVNTAVETFFPEFSTEAAEILTEVSEQAAALTKAFLGFCQSVYIAKTTSSKKEWKEEKESLGWASSTALPYVKVSEYMMDIPEYNLELLDIKTIMALCADKYRPVLEQLKSDRLTVEEVRSLMSEINKETKKEKPAKEKEGVVKVVNGKRCAEIPPIYSDIAVSSLINQMKEEGVAAQTIASEGILLRQWAIARIEDKELPEHVNEFLQEAFSLDNITSPEVIDDNLPKALMPSKNIEHSHDQYRVVEQQSATLQEGFTGFSSSREAKRQPLADHSVGVCAIEQVTTLQTGFVPKKELTIEEMSLMLEKKRQQMGIIVTPSEPLKIGDKVRDVRDTGLNSDRRYIVLSEPDAKNKVVVKLIDGSSIKDPKALGKKANQNCFLKVEEVS